ncbi:MSL1 [Branchiostoma lanceolatum]|uniref:MSL1 protein n=1 Tax=Branchiostoma lanceolatum TaxID=7740 RepID=A0A8J9VE84_BRALA|nr:MSL1 [Branchiostoma lanceolatum]
MATVSVWLPQPRRDAASPRFTALARDRKVMATENMKSEVCGPSKIKLEPKALAKGRNLAAKVATLNATLNGDLSNANHEDTSDQANCLRDSEESKPTNGTQGDANEPKPVGHGAKDTENSEDLKKQVKQLKELLLLHLDLIQEQQEQLQQKEKQLAKEREDKEALQCRLERMERRMSLVKREAAPSVSSMSPTSSCSSPLMMSSEMMPSTSRDSQPLRRGIKRSLQDSSSFGRRLAAKKIKRAIHFSQRSQIKESHEVRGRTADGRHSAQDDGIDGIMRTSSQYYSSLHQAPPSPVLTVKTPQKISKDDLHLPPWRVNNLTSSSLDEKDFVEDITDDAYNRRHQKLELDEKKRKRWDIQRIREKRQYEKLLMRNMMKKCNSDTTWVQPTIGSFFPEPEEVEHVEVGDTVPVVAFGQPLPCITKSEFSLPWNVGSYSSTRGRRSRGRGRGRRKFY